MWHCLTRGKVTNGDEYNFLGRVNKAIQIGIGSRYDVIAANT